MKGLLISLVTLFGFGLTAILIAHFTRPKTYLRLFVTTAAGWMPGYFLIYWLTPADLGFLPPAWQCANQEFDAGYGFVIFLLNCHTVVDCFFGFCTGFSVSMLLAILKADGLTEEQITGLFKLDDNTDRIYSWRLPYLQRIGWLQSEPGTNRYRLTSRGRRIAWITYTLKRLLNLGKGG